MFVIKIYVSCLVVGKRRPKFKNRRIFHTIPRGFHFRNEQSLCCNFLKSVKLHTLAKKIMCDIKNIAKL
jgi:hypothetical protein